MCVFVWFVCGVCVCLWLGVCEVEGVCMSCVWVLGVCGVCEAGSFVCVGVWGGFVCGVRVRVWCVCFVCDVCVCVLFVCGVCVVMCLCVWCV